MSNALVTQPAQQPEPLFRPAKPRALEVMADRLSVEPSKMLETLKATVFKGASNEELLALTVVANEYDLNPFLKELYAFPAKGGGIVPVVSVDGWIKMLNRQARFDGIEFEMFDGGDGKPQACTAVIWIKDRSRPVRVTEYFSECSRNTDPWNKSPRRMLRHKALIQGARVAFGLSGVQDEEEARDAGTIDENRLASARPVFSTAPTLSAPKVEAIDVTQLGAGDDPTSSNAGHPRGNSDAHPSAPATPAPVASDQTTPSARARLGELLTTEKIAPEEFVEWAIGKRLLSKGMDLEEITEARAQGVVDQWEKWKAEIIAKRG